MSNPRKFWLVLIGAVLAMAVIACSCGSINPISRILSTPTTPPTQTAQPSPTLRPSPTAPPAPTSPPEPTALTEQNPNLAGYWLDAETNSVFAIEWLGDKYAVTSALAPTDILTVTSQSWLNGALTWTYYVQSTGVSVAFTTISAEANSLYTSWSSSTGNAGTETLQRVASPIPPQTGGTQPSGQSLAGRWNDPDTTGTITTIVALGDGYAVLSVTNPSRGGNELTATNWSNGVLTWTYCVPSGNCITTVTVSLEGDSLYTTWSDNYGDSGETIFERLP